MPQKDLPDYTREVILRYEGGFIGLEELAARLKSIAPWDLRGNIVLMEDFESEETEWTDASGSVGCSVVRTSRHKYSGDWAVKVTYTIGGLASTYLYRRLHFPGLLKYGLFFRLGIDTSCRLAHVNLDFYDGATHYNVGVYYSLDHTLLYVITTGSAGHTISDTLSLAHDEVTWLPVLLTFDLETGYYDKLYFADQEYDISDVPLNISVSVSAPECVLQVCGDGYAVGDGYHYVDDIIIAENVP